MLKDLINSNISEEELYQAIQDRVANMLDKQPELLMSYLYRLDIEETKIKAAINSNVETVKGLAVLILERQKQRIETKSKYQQGPIEGWEW